MYKLHFHFLKNSLICNIYRYVILQSQGKRNIYQKSPIISNISTYYGIITPDAYRRFYLTVQQRTKIFIWAKIKKNISFLAKINHYLISKLPARSTGLVTLTSLIYRGLQRKNCNNFFFQNYDNGCVKKKEAKNLRNLYAVIDR